MSKRNNFYTVINQKFSQLKKFRVKIWKNAKPFLAPKYWLLYLISFCFGLYLWGPTQGWQKIRAWQFPINHRRDKLPASEALQKQLMQLRQELKAAQNEKTVPEFSPGNFSRPALGEALQGFEWMESENAWRLHSGVDIGLAPGSNILAAAAGTVLEIKEIISGDYTVTVNHGNGWKSIYSNLAQVTVTEGQPLIKGVIIGKSSNTGCDPKVPSFHFGIYHNQQPIDPEKIIGGLTNQNGAE